MNHTQRLAIATVSLTVAMGFPRPVCSADQIFPLTDKTLVAWVTLADLEQRAGSALTLIDDQERFDAIVFAEKSPGKWMAGSDFFRRTPDDQAEYATETADPKTLIQIAVAYEGRTVTIYRDAALYARYEIDGPQSFSAEVTVLIGLRYVGGMGEIGFLAGSVEEARIYNVALDARSLGKLKPCGPSNGLPATQPKPIGLWTFENGSTADAMGVFPPGQLRGRARLAGGKLHLDGRDGYLECYPPRPAVVQDMFYRPRARETGRMWDTWFFLHEGVYHLYYLANRGSSWNNISLATSPDGVHWTERGRLLSKREDAVWMGTGSTWKSPDFQRDGRFQMNFSEWRGPRQTIFFAQSTNLVDWRRLDDSHEFRQDTRWYEPDGRWDCIYTIPRPGGGLFGYWTATPKASTGGRFGFGESLDGVHWQALPPPKAPGVTSGEVGGVQRIGDRYYMMFGSGGAMVTLVADRPQGPFHPAEKNFRLLSGHTYFSRFFPTPDGLLVNHHAIARNGPVSLGLLKSTRVDDQGTLRLGWWKGNEALKRLPVEVGVLGPSQAPDGGLSVAMLSTTFNAAEGLVLEGQVDLPKTSESARVGLYLECGKDSGAAILLDHEGAAELGPLRGDGVGFQVEKRVDRQTTFPRPAPFRLVVKGALLEFYLDDYLIECFSLPTAATGRLGLIGETFDELRAWRP